jgi:ParB-like chromosome segregation protein Spo0J
LIQYAIESVPVDNLREHPKNARRGNIEAIAASIKAHGFIQPIVAQRPSGVVGVGNHRLRAAKAMGLPTVPVIWVEVDDDQLLRMLIADNRSSDLAGYDDQELLRTLRELGSLQGTLFDQDSLEDLVAKANEIPVITEHEFHGGYADEGAEMEARAQEAERIAEALKDLVILMKPAVYQQFVEHVKVLQKRWDLNGVSAVVIAAVANCAQSQSDIDAAKIQMDRMRAWREKVEWAIPHGDRAKFLEDFA